VNAAQIVEAVLFASDAPLKSEEIARADESLDEDLVETALQVLRTEYDETGRAFQVVELAEGYQILTRPEFSTYLERFDTVPRPSRLSAPALETLAIIAYRQPISRMEIEYIRGVGVSGVIRTLQDRALVDVVARAETLGRPLLYGPTRRFLDHFGFGSLEDLPRPEELPVVLRERIPLGPQDGDEEGTDPNQVPLELNGGSLGRAGGFPAAREGDAPEEDAPREAAAPGSEESEAGEGEDDETHVG
jgi:segregation and condensation protein B